MQKGTLEDKFGRRTVAFNLKDAFSEGEEAFVHDLRIVDSKIKTRVVCKVFKNDMETSTNSVRQSYEFLNDFEKQGMDVVSYRGVLTGKDFCALVLTDLTQFGSVIAEQDAIQLDKVSPKAKAQMNRHYDIGCWNGYSLSQLGSRDVHMILQTARGQRAVVTDVSLCSKVENDYVHQRQKLKVNDAPRDNFGWNMRASCAILLRTGGLYVGKNIEQFAAALFPNMPKGIQAAYYHLYSDLLENKKDKPGFLTPQNVQKAAEYIADAIHVRENVQPQPFQIPKKPIILEVAARHFLDAGHDHSVTMKIAYDPKQIIDMTFPVHDFEQRVKPSQVIEMTFADGTILRGAEIKTYRSDLGVYVGSHPKNWVQLKFKL